MYQILMKTTALRPEKLINLIIFLGALDECLGGNAKECKQETNQSRFNQISEITLFRNHVTLKLTS